MVEGHGQGNWPSFDLVKICVAEGADHFATSHYSRILAPLWDKQLYAFGWLTPTDSLPAKHPNSNGKPMSAMASHCVNTVLFLAFVRAPALLIWMGLSTNEQVFLSPQPRLFALCRAPLRHFGVLGLLAGIAYGTLLASCISMSPHEEGSARPAELRWSLRTLGKSRDINVVVPTVEVMPGGEGICSDARGTKSVDESSVHSP